MRYDSKFRYNLFITIGVMSLPTISYAYIDPGSGYALIQVLIAAVTAAATFISMRWKKLTQFFRSSNHKEPLNENDMSTKESSPESEQDVGTT